MEDTDILLESMGNNIFGWAMASWWYAKMKDSPLHRLAVDNIIAAEVVTAKGQVVWASKEENEDLFWCIRGAGNKFGVVTKVI